MASRRQLSNTKLNSINKVVRRGSASGDPQGLRVRQPCGVKIVRTLNVVHTRTMRATGGDEFARVVAVRAADHDDYIALPCEFNRRVLALFGWLANGVDEPLTSDEMGRTEKAMAS